MCASAVEDESFPGPPVRWRSAHRRCCESQFSRHGRPACPIVSACGSLGADRQSLWSLCVRGYMRVAELARPGSAKQTHEMQCTCSLAPSSSAVCLGGLTRRAFKPCLPAPFLLWQCRRNSLEPTASSRAGPYWHGRWLLLAYGRSRPRAVNLAHRLRTTLRRTHRARRVPMLSPPLIP